jgi:hypothetical protein
VSCLQPFAPAQLVFLAQDGAKLLQSVGCDNERPKDVFPLIGGKRHDS